MGTPRDELAAFAAWTWTRAHVEAEAVGEVVLQALGREELRGGPQEHEHRQLADALERQGGDVGIVLNRIGQGIGGQGCGTAADGVLQLLCRCAAEKRRRVVAQGSHETCRGIFYASEHAVMHDVAPGLRDSLAADAAYAAPVFISADPLLYQRANAPTPDGCTMHGWTVPEAQERPIPAVGRLAAAVMQRVNQGGDGPPEERLMIDIVRSMSVCLCKDPFGRRWIVMGMMRHDASYHAISTR